jgi:hypothetical protein
MATTRYPLGAYSAGKLSGAVPDEINGRDCLKFSNAGTDYAIWTGVIPQGWTGTPTAIVNYFTDVTTGSFTWSVEVEAIAEGDTTDLDAATSFDTANSAADTVPATAGYLAQHSITLTNHDSSAAGDQVRFKLTRTDTTTGNAYMTVLEIRDAA